MIFGAPAWVWPAALLGALALGIVLWSYGNPARHASMAGGARAAAFGLKLLGLLALALCLTEPMVRRSRALPGANQLVVLVDTSRSLEIHDRGAAGPRADDVRELLRADAAWLERAGQDFDLRRFSFDARTRSFQDPEELTFTGDESALARALTPWTRRARSEAERPVAAVVVFTDGIATDGFEPDFPWSDLPPVYPVVIGAVPARDLGIARIAVSQTGFEESPVTVRVEVRAFDCEGESITVSLLDEQGTAVAHETRSAVDGEAQDFELRAPPELTGVHLYRVEARFADKALGNETGATSEATEANNTRWITVDRGSGPYRVLYVSGRPNWEFKFLRRALDEDPELDLVGLVRIARRQPKFTFRAGAERTNTLWEGFGPADEDAAEQYDEPVLLRLGTSDEFELRGGFPRTREDLFGYHALVLDDIEATFFTADQMALIEEFVSRRGGGYLALGGRESFLGGSFEGTPLGEMLPVYLDREPPMSLPPDGFVLDLTREGWLEPWVRLRATEAMERARLAQMPAFRTLNRVGGVKPGGLVLALARDGSGAPRPALVVQRFGKGRAAAALIGDFWRWDLQRDDPKKSDLGTAWRQTLRWLVSDVPRAVELDVQAADGGRSAGGSAVSREVELSATALDEAFEPAHNARVRITVTPPAGAALELDAVPSTTRAGTWVARYIASVPGPYRARVDALREDGSELGGREVGWVCDPAATELASLTPGRALLADIAQRTGGEVIDAQDLADFAAGLVHAEVPITEEELVPMWHAWWVFLFAIACFCAEWGLRRVRGMP